MSSAAVSLRCPRCLAGVLSEGPLHNCVSCRGTWIEEKTLEEHVSDRPSRPFDWSAARANRNRLPCAVCREPMDALILFHQPVDRCKPHGVWFDKHELAAVVERSRRTSQVTTLVAQPSGTSSFAGDVAATAVLDAGLETAFLGAEAVAEIGGDSVLEGILDVIGGIFSAIDF